MLLERQRVTQDDFRAYIEQPENADKWFELIDGVIHEVIMPKPIHAIVALIVAGMLRSFVIPHNLGQVVGDGCLFYLPNGDTVIPDAAYISNEREAGIPDEYHIAPDVAVEVISPSNRPREVNAKVESHLASGTRQVWVLYPEQRVLDVWTPGADGTAIKRKYTVADMLTGGDVLPGFSVVVGELFPKA
jgi:Uma2 family endonuclease